MTSLISTSINDVKIFKDLNGQKSIMLFSFDYKHGTKVVFLPSDIHSRLIVPTEQLKKHVGAKLTEALSLGEITLTEARSILSSVGLPTNDFEL